MVKLGEQLKQKQVSPVRQTRTQRVAQKQEIVRQRMQYEASKKRAEELQKTEFANVTSVEEYRQKYQALDPNIQQFFATPETVQQQRDESIVKAKTSVQDKISYYQQKLKENKEYYDKKEDYYEDKAEEYLKKGDDKRAGRYYERAQDYEDRGEEKEEYYEGIIKGLKEGQTKLNQGQYLTFDAIFDYAKDVGGFERDKEEARNDAKSDTRIQDRKIRDLEQAGYTPQVIQKYSNGNPKSVSLSYYNQATGDWANVTTLSDTSKVDVSGLQKLGYSEPQERTLLVGGKEFKFSTKVGIYKEADGDIVTPYGETGYTEDQLIRQAQNETYQQWVEERPSKAVYTDPKAEPTAFTFGGKTYIPTTDIIGYVDQGTISTEPKYMEVRGEIDWKKPDIDAGLKWIGEQYKKIPTGRWTLSPLGISPVDFGTGFELNLSEKIGQARDWLSGKATGVDEKLQEIESVDIKIKDLEEKYQAQGQARFEDIYAKQIIYGEITPEQAEKEFTETESYKIWQKQYAQEYEETFKGAIARENIGYKSALKYGSQKFLLGTGEFVLGRIETPKATAETGAVVGGIVLTYGQLSPAVASAIGKTLIGATGVYGAYKTFDPKSTPSEVFGGALMLGTAVATTGYGVYKYLQKPIIKTVKIPAPKKTIKAYQTKGYDVKYITEQGTIQKAVYPQQKLAQVGVAGRRTTVTTQWRSSANKYLKTSFKNIYEGVPTQQLAKTYTITGTRGTYAVTIGKSGYQKAYDLLRKYGYTKYQATSTLRYTAPRVYEQYLKQGEIFVKGGQAVGKFTYETTRPVIDVDDVLGIKTRGGMTTRDYSIVQRKLLETKEGGKVIFEKQLTKTYGVNLKGIESFKKVQEQWSIGAAKVSETRAGLDVLKLDNASDIYQKVTYKDVATRSRTFLKGTGEFTKDLVKLNLETLPRDTRVSRAILIDKIEDLTKQQYGTTFIGGKKTPFAKTFALTDEVDDVFTQAGSVKPTPSKDITKVIDKLEDIKTPRSEYYGTGLYEQSIGGMPTQQLQTLQNQLKTITIPEVKVTQLKDIIQVKTGVNFAKLTQTGGLTALGIKSALKTDVQLKTDLKVQSDLKNLIKSDIGIKSVELQALGVKTAPLLKTQLKSMLDVSAPSVSLDSPTFRPPTIKTPSIPIPTGFVIPYLKDEVSKRARKSIKGFEELAYLPDFTSRALGLAPETISEKQAQKKLKQLLTGFEIRRGVRIK